MNKKILLAALTLVLGTNTTLASPDKILNDITIEKQNKPFNFYDSNSVIENVKFLTNVNTNGGGATGGILSFNGDKTTSVISNSVFENNKALGSVYSMGGAIFDAAVSLEINNSEFTKNSALNASDGDFGGAIFADGNSIKPELNSSLTINDTIFSENSAIGGPNKAAGGAVATQYISNVNINRTKFNGNFVKGNSTKNTASSYAAGGALAPTYMADQMGVHYSPKQTVNINDSEFTNNYASDTYRAYGGAIGAATTFSAGKALELNIKNTTFNSNYLTDTAAAKGGAIGSVGSNTLINIADSKFINNYITNSKTSYGGAIYTQLHKINIENTDFINNHIDNATTAYGGAIADIGSTITIKNSNFINNSANGSTTAGGAIFFQGNGAAVPATINLVADGKDIEFTGNKAGVTSNAIYQGSNSRLNFNISSGNKITLNDRINSSATNTIMNINGTNSDFPTSGTLVLNENMNSYWGNVNLYGGTLQIGEKGTFFKNTPNFTTYDGVTLDLQNNKTDNISIKNYIINGTTNVKIDADLANEKIDNFNITSTSGSGNLNISSIDMTSEFNENVNTKTFDFLTGANINTTLNSSLNTILTQSSRYDVTLNKNTLTFDRSEYTGGLAGAVALDDKRHYQMLEDEVLTDWNTPTQNELQGETLIVTGHNNGVSGTNHEGILVNNSSNLIINNIGSTSGNDIEKSWNGFHSIDGGAVNNLGGTTVIVDSIITNNSADNKGGAINNDKGVINIIAHNSNVIFQNNKASDVSNAIHNNSGTINLNGSSGQAIIFNDSITSEDNTGEININAANSDVASVNENSPQNGTVILNNNMSEYKGDVNLYHGTIKVGENGTFFNPENFNIYGCTLDFANSKIQNYNLGNLSVSDQVDILVDADLAKGVMDTISANNIFTDSGKIYVSGINLLSDSTIEKQSINFTNENLKDAITYSGDNISYSPLYKYAVSYDKENGNFDFARFGGTNNYTSYNPSLFAAPVAAQFGGYLTQLNSYNQAFMNIDMRMLMTKEERQAFKLRNKYAGINSPMVFSPTFLPEEKQGAWVRPYSAFESVQLRGGPTVSNVMYGTFLGADSEMYDLGHGFDGQFSLYAGYNGSHQAFDGNSLYQNGGTLGATGVIYKGNFFSAMTINAGGNSVEASTMYGSENFPMVMAGIASKTGYNFELADGKFIIQPNYLMSYSFVNTFDFTNANGLKITSSPLNAIQVAPGIKFIGNLKNGWQPYLSVSMIWNFMDQTKFNAAEISLPQLSVKPYVEYGIGVQKRWGDRFTGFFETMIRNGGRNGVALSCGLRWSIGKTPQTSISKPHKQIILPPAKITISNGVKS